ncbi:MAG: monovalent cation/H+ antiporter subunit D [Peptococcaceae bacterium BICA1-8]|nr:MAG: monovalent cation/H+ antiporter subunit D [Peptococcaceae bacterium BICA1-8]
MSSFHPGLILIFAGIFAGFLPNRIRQAVMVGAPALAVLSMFNLPIDTLWQVDFINNMQLQLLRVDKLSWVFGLIFSIMALIGNIYSLHNKNSWEAAAALLYAGSSLGVVFAGDWMTLIFFWELMAASSVFLIWYKGNAQARGAGYRYILVHAFGGNLLLAGIFLKMVAGQPEVTLLTGTQDAAFWLILLGVAINAAIPPLHAWLTDAYPEGTITGSVFLSSFTTKVAVYTLIRLFAGTELLIWTGVIMALYGVVYAVLENDIRRLLAYHIISQVGYMVAAVGMGTELALNGATSHAFSHILYKSLLFMGAGAVIYATGRRKLSELGGLFRQMPVAVILYMIGAFSISGVPLWNGFISKSMIISAASYNEMPAVELLLYLASVGTWLHTGLKLPYYMFFGPDRGIQLERKLPINMYVAMAGGAFLCTLFGVAPNLLYQYLPFAAEYHPYSWDHVVSTMQLLVAALAAFWIFIPKLGGEPTISVDTDWFYRKPVKIVINGLAVFVCNTRDYLGTQGMAALKSILPIFANPLKWAPQTGEGPVVEYDEDRYRLPVGMTVLMSIVVFIITVSYIWIT